MVPFTLYGKGHHLDLLGEGRWSMQKETEHIEVIMANRRYLYRLLQTIFGNEPSPALLEQLSVNHTQQALRLFYDPGISEVDSYLELLDGIADNWTDDPEPFLDRLSYEYTRIFYGPGTLPSPPWESVYVNGEQVLFQEATLRVRQIYVNHHFLPKGYPNEPDDHIALELDFMYNLASQTQEEFVAGDTDSVIELLRVQQQFLREHLLRWVDSFAKGLKKVENPLLYPESAAFTAYYLKSDDSVISELLAFLDQLQ
jgi:TorA maturation chaperone TorD